MAGRTAGGGARDTAHAGPSRARAWRGTTPGARWATPPSRPRWTPSWPILRRARGSWWSADCFPTGRLGYFAERVARRGLVCLLTATSTPSISHPSGGGPLLGTNPLCLALPGEPRPEVIDVSMGRVTYGAVLKASAAGAALPEGAAVMADGMPTTDPSRIQADEAGIMPFGSDQAYKGFALALLVEMLCSSLAGTEGHAVVALLAAPVAAPMDALREAAGDRRLPGDRSAALLRAAEARGEIELPDDLWAWIDADSPPTP